MDMLLSYAMTKPNETRHTPFVVAIDGHGGSGKSTLARNLSERLGAEIIHTDDFASWENPVEWWPLVIERVFTPIDQGARTLSYPRSKWWADHHPEPVIDQPVTPTLILEGVTTLRTEFRPWLNFGIFVDTPTDICLQRGFERDRGMDGKPDEEIRKMWRDWLAAEDGYIARDNPRAYAHRVIDGSQPLGDIFELLAIEIETEKGAAEGLATLGDS